MRRFNVLFLSFCVLAMLCSLTGCNEQPAVPLLEEQAVLDTLEKAGLPGTIYEPESRTSLQTTADIHHVNYVIRDETELYEGSDLGMFVADITSGEHTGRRLLYTMFDQSVASEQIEWEDWKAYMVFTALLWGGFEHEEELYQAFCDEALPEGKTAFLWEAQLSGGYCIVTYGYRLGPVDFDENNFPVRKQSATLRVKVYESCELYQDVSAALEQARQTAGAEPAA